MLINLNEILSCAEAEQCAIGAFNTPNLECINAVLAAAEELGRPVILSHAEPHEGVAPLSVIGPVMLTAARGSSVRVCVHLDHCENLDYMERALALGFTGAMYDGSALPYGQNAENTRQAVALAKRYGAGLEAEIGTMAAREGGDETGGGPVYTDPALAERFCADTGIDALAASFGTAHGIYKSTPVLDFGRVKTIKEKTGLPLVMHGGSGVSDGDYRTAIRSGIRKINYYSYMSRAGAQAVRDLLAAGDVTFFHDLALAAQEAMRRNVLAAMRTFSNMD